MEEGRRNSQMDQRLISADSHVTEPPELWTRRIDKEFRDRAPRTAETVIDGKAGTYFLCDGLAPRTIAHGIGCDNTAEELPEFFEDLTLDRARAGGWDPAARVKDMDTDGVDAEVLYTTYGFRLFWLEDARFQEACFRAYNDWLAEFCRHDPKRLIGLGLISLYDLDNAVKELERCARLGLRGVLIWCSPPADQPYSSRSYDRFFATAQDLGMPISLHAVTGMGPESQWFGDDRYLHFMYFPIEVQRSLTTLICSGVLERFPQLKLVSAENDIGWIPHFLQRLDGLQELFRHLYPRPMNLKASEYFYRQVFATFISDPVGISQRHRAGVENIMWSSDYPHVGCTWPKSLEIVDRETAKLPRAEVAKIVGENAARLYGIQLESDGSESVSQIEEER